MQQPPPRRGSGSLPQPFTFEAKLEDEEQLLEAVLATMARGPLPADVWEKLHAAGRRDERLAELAFAFESVSQGKRLKAAPPPVGAEFLFRAAIFFGDVFGDEMGAVTYLERALGLAPNHVEAFAKLEALLSGEGNTRKLAEAYATAAHHRPRGEQAPLLRRAAQLLADAGGADEKVIELAQQALRLEPGDEESRARLEALYLRTNRLRDVVRLLEQALTAEPPLQDDRRAALLARLIDLYADRLHEAERALPHVEALLALDPAHEEARKIAQKLLVTKGLAGRAAAALSKAFEASGTPQDVVRFLTIELESTRGPRRAQLLGRLGALKFERMGDEKGALEAYEQAVALDAADDELRARYVALAGKSGRWLDAAKALSRAIATLKEPASKHRATAQLGEVLVRAGDPKRARATLASVLAAEDAPADAVLGAARSLREILGSERDPKGLCDVLERLSSLEPDPELRRDVDEQLAAVATSAKDTARAIAAYERLLDTSARAKALAALAPLYEASGDPLKHAHLLEEQARDTGDAATARGLMLRAAEVRSRDTKDAAAAIASCQAIIERFGPAKDALALLLPLLEQQRQWAELAGAMAQEAGLATGPERAALMSRLGLLRLQRLRDAPGATAAFEEALAFDATDKTARATLEKLAAVGEHRLEAARVLEPIYRREDASGPLLKILEVKGALAADVEDRLAALREAADLAEASAVDPTRAVDVVGRALSEAVAADRPLGEWLERLDRVTRAGSDAKRRAAILGQAIGDREVTSADTGALVRRAAEAHAASGDAAAAIALLRRALAFEPQSAELLSRIDDLLRDQGTPRERVALYRAALASAEGPRRRELLHRVGGIERHDLGDLRAAIETFVTALADDPDDGDAYAALADLYAQTQRWADLCTLLEARVARTEGPAALDARAMLAEIAAGHGDEARAREQCARLLEDPRLSSDQLFAVERAADVLQDVDLTRAGLVRRIEVTGEPREQVALFERLGELDEARRGDPIGAIAAWKRGAALAEEIGDDEAARRLYGRAHRVAPDDLDVTGRLVALYERAGLWSDLPPLYGELAGASAARAERVDLLLRTARVLSERLGDATAAAREAGRAFELAPESAEVLAAFEALCVGAGAIDTFERSVDEGLGVLEASRTTDGDARARLLLARGRVLATDPSRADDASRAYRAVLSDARVVEPYRAQALSALEALVASDPEAPRRRADRRWILEWTAEHAPEEERVARLLDWARAEETTFADALRALSLHKRALALDPDSGEALDAVSRLTLATGDTDAALSALRARRDRAAGTGRVALELEIAQVLLSRTTRWQEALDALRAVLTESPGDPTARTLASQLLAHRATRADAIRMLEQACDAVDDEGVREQILGRLLDAPAEADEGDVRRTWFERLGELQRSRGDLESALGTSLRAARETPEALVVWDRVEELSRALGRPDDAASLYDEVLARALPASQALAIGERAVQFHEEWFDDSSRVVRILDRVLEIDPTADWAFDRLKLLLDAAERWDDLFALYDRALDHASGKQLVELLEEAAQTAKDFADRPDRAIEYLEQLHELKPGDPRLVNALERLYERQGRHRELVSLLTARLPSFKRDEARRARTRIAALWLDELGDAGQALDMVEPLLQQREEQADPEVFGLLERVLAASPPGLEARRSTRPPSASEAPPPKSRRSRKSEVPASARTSVRQRAAAWLREYYEAAGRDADLARMLLVELEVVRSAKDRGRRHMQIAALHEKVGDAASALEQVGSAVVLAPSDEAKRATLAELAERTARFERHADLLAAAADATDDAQVRATLTLQAAAIRADRVGDPAGAIALFASVLDMKSSDDQDARVAVRRLEPLLEAAGRDEERLAIIERAARVEETAEARRSALGRAARLAARRGQDARAIGLWEQCLDHAGDDMEALDGLVELLDRSAWHERLVEVLLQRATAAPEAERRRADRVRAAGLLGDALDRPDAAISTWREIEREFGEADDAALALATLLRATRRWSELAELLERSSRRTDDDGTRAELLRQLGDVQREQLDAAADAVTSYGRALAASPTNAGSRAGLLSLAAEGAHRAEAIRLLLGALRTCDDWRAILELTAHRLAAAVTDDERLAILGEASRLAEQRAGDPGLAFEASRRAFLLAPDRDVSAAEMARLAEAAGAWDSLASAYREAVAMVEATRAALAARFRALMGAVLDTRLGDPAAALDAYVRVVQEVADVAAGRATIDVAGRLARWDVVGSTLVRIVATRADARGELLDATEQAAEAHDAWDRAAAELAEAAVAARLDPASAHDIEARIAHWYRDRLRDSSGAEAAFLRALAHVPTDAMLLAELAELQRAHPGRPLVETLLRLSQVKGGDVALLREASEVARTAVGDASLARTILHDLLQLARDRWLGSAGVAGDPELAPVTEWAIETLAKLYEEDGDARAEVDTLVEGDALPFAPEIRWSMRRRAAWLSLDRLGDDERAVRLYLALLDDVPQDAEAVERVASVYVAHGRTADLLALRERQIATSTDVTQRLALRLEAARLLVSLGEPRAVDVLRANLAEDPRHEATVEALAGELESERRLPELRDLLADQAQQAETAGAPERGASLWAHAARVAASGLADPRAAESFHGRVVALVPSAASLDALARLTAARGDAMAAAEWLERLLAIQGPEAADETTIRLAVALERAGALERATDRLEQALSERPQAATLREHLSTLYREHQAWDRLARLVATSAEHAADKPERMARLLEAARLYTERCAQPDLAVPLLQQASDLSPEEPKVRLELAGALASARRFEEARTILQDMITAFGGRRPKERAPVHYQIARLELAMGNRARALVELDTATRVDPQDPEILRTLGQLARDDGQLDRAEKSYRALLAVLRRKDDSSQGQSVARSEVLLELSDIAKRQGEEERAREVLESALEASTKSDFEHGRLEAALRARGDHETLVRVLEAKLGRIGDAAGAVRALAELGDVLTDRLGRSAEALPVRLRAVGLDPLSPATHDAALTLARAVGRVESYAQHVRDLAERAAEQGDRALASALLVRLGAVARSDLHDDRAAAAYYERALELGHSSSDVLRALDGVYETLGDFDKQARILALRAELDAVESGPRAAGDATYRLAALRLASTGGCDEGVALLRRALEMDPDLDRAEQIARAALERHASHGPLLDLYEHIGRQPGHERALVDALRLRARLPGAEGVAVRAAVEAALGLGDTALAESLLEETVRAAAGAALNVTDLAWALDTLAGLKRAAGDLRRAVELKTSAARIADPDVARKLQFEVARLAAEDLQDLDLAAETYASLHQHDPADREAWEPLASVYRRRGDLRRLTDLLAVVVDFVDDTAERGRLRLERVRAMVEGLGLSEAEAVPLLREIVDEDPSQVDAALMLAGILERSGERDELASLLSRQLDAAKDRSDAASVASLSLRLGALLEGSDRLQARDVYYAGLDWEPRSQALLDALTRLLGDEGDPAERADLLERRLALETGPQAEAVAQELARARTALGDEAGAERALELGVRAHPGGAALKETLEQAYRERSDWRKLADLWVVDAASKTDVSARVTRLREAAALRLDTLNEPAGAAEALALAHEAKPDDADVLQALVHSLLAADDLIRAQQVLTRAIDLGATSESTRAALLAARGDVRARTGDAAGALEDLEAAFEIDRATYAAPLAARLEASRAAAQAAGDPAGERLVQLRAAQVLPYAGQVEEARSVLAALVRADARDGDALRTLASLEAALEHWDAASAALRRLVPLEEGEAIVGTAVRLADVCERAGRPGDARGALERARGTAPRDATVRERLERVYELTGAWQELADLALAGAGAGGDVAERFAALVRAGSILLERAGDGDAALALLGEAHALRPNDAQCVALLADAYTTTGQGREAVALLEQALAPYRGKRAREAAPLYVRLARAARYAGDEAGEVRSLAQALDCDSQNPEVCADVALRAVELDQLELANRALRAITLLKTPGPMSRALAYQYMGELARRQGDPKRALMLLKRALTEDPTLEGARALIEGLERGGQ